MSFMSIYLIHVMSCHFMSFMSIHVIHVLSGHSCQFMSFMSIHFNSCHSCQFMPFMSCVIGLFRKFSKVGRGGREDQICLPRPSSTASLSGQRQKLPGHIWSQCPMYFCGRFQKFIKVGREGVRVTAKLSTKALESLFALPSPPSKTLLKLVTTGLL